MNVILRTIASQQGGVITRAQALEAGYNADDVDRELRRGSLVAIRRGAYVEREAREAMSDVDLHKALVHAVVLRLSAPAVVSHVSAAVMHGLPTWGLDLSEVQVSRSDLHSPRREGGVHHHTGEIRPSDIVTVDGLQLTALPRTVIDVARTNEFEAAVCVADAAFNTDKSAHAATLLRLNEMRDWQGSRNAGSVVAFADGRAESVGESRTRVVMKAVGLPEPELQVEFHNKAGLFVARTDLYVKEFRTVGEFDGKQKYGQYLRPGEDPTDVIWREKKREDQLRLLGLEIARIIWPDLDQPFLVKHKFLQAFERATSRGLRAA